MTKLKKISVSISFFYDGLLSQYFKPNQINPIVRKPNQKAIQQQFQMFLNTPTPDEAPVKPPWSPHNPSSKPFTKPLCGDKVKSVLNGALNPSPS